MPRIPIRHPATWVTIALLFLGSTMISRLVEMQKLRQATEALEPIYRVLRPTMQLMTATWTSGGITHTLTTPKLDDETDEQWLQRHANSVAAAKEVFPPDGD